MGTLVTLFGLHREFHIHLLPEKDNWKGNPSPSGTLQVYLIRHVSLELATTEDSIEMILNALKLDMSHFTEQEKGLRQSWRQSSSSSIPNQQVSTGTEIELIVCSHIR